MAKQVDYKAVGLRIKTLRLKNNIYQTELAKSIGVSQTHMSNIESGRAGLTLENLVKMTNIFNCGIDEIVFGEEKAKKERNCSDFSGEFHYAGYRAGFADAEDY